jgi:hypothetical protein
LAVSGENFICAYLPEGVTTIFYSRRADRLSYDFYRAPHWTRGRILDPETLEEVAEGDPGLLSILDLANLDFAIHVLTDLLGVKTRDGFQLIGKAASEDLKASRQLADQVLGS